ncbi:MAG: 50S ribosomal protein L35 [Oscillospiraceae bacterium]|jgi:large subunit ribosomal protein L35|nr:50S ribosomal protein L35 [Oscillospiraceae bacterium]
MPKQKTHKGAAKRFRLTKSGMLKRACAFRNHMLGGKSSKQKRNLRKGGYVDPSQAGTMKKLIPYA